MPESLATPTLPARSVAWPDTDRFLPSVDNVTGVLRLFDATPDSSSVAAKAIVTGVLFQPLFATGDCVAVTIGAVLSMLSVTLAVAVLPALSTALPETTWLAPSALTVTGAGHFSMPDSESAQAKVSADYLHRERHALLASDFDRDPVLARTKRHRPFKKGNA